MKSWMMAWDCWRWQVDGRSLLWRRPAGPETGLRRGRELQRHGCPKDSVAFNIASDGQALTFFLTSLPRRSAERRYTDRKACNIDIKLHVPQVGVTRCIIRTCRIRELDEGDVGNCSTSFGIGAMPAIFGISTVVMSGPVSQDYYKRGIATVLTCRAAATRAPTCILRRACR